VRDVKASLDAWRARAETAEVRLLHNIAESPSSLIVKSEPGSVTASARADVKPAVNIAPSVDRTRLEEAEAVLTGVRSEMESYRAKCEELQEELETAREQVEEVMGEMEGLQRELREARERPVVPAGQTEQRNETGSNAGHNSADDKVQQRISDLERENASLLAERVELFRRNVTIQHERDDAWSTVEDSLKAQEVLRERVDELARRLEEKERVIAALRMERDDARRELEEVNVELDLDGIGDKARTNRAKDGDGPSGIPITVGLNFLPSLTPLTSCTVSACSRVPLARDAFDHRVFSCGK
jgi:predicted  nucleic acid-binding Zn-ribbon protein